MYVDDVRVILKATRPGVRFCQDCNIFWMSVDQLKEDLESMESDMTRTAKVLRDAMNSICPDLSFTTETSDDFPEKTLPTLDYQMWVVDVDPETDSSHVQGDSEHQALPDPVPLLAEDPRNIQPPRKKRPYQQGIYSFYSKSMGSKHCMLELSAMNWNSRKASLSQEVVRRLQSTSKELPQEDKNNILDNFTDKLLRSGYSRTQSREIITC